MTRRNLRRIILFGSIVLMGLFIVQGFWIKRAFDIEERQFNHSVQVALKNIADTIVAENPLSSSSETRIRQLSSSFFFAELNASFDPELLDKLLKNELGMRIGYELGIYNAADDTLVYGVYVPATIQWQLDNANPLAKHEDVEKMNFALYFPNKFSVIAGELNIWIFSTFMLLLMAAFFIYAILTLLRERRLAEIKEDFINNLTHEFKTPIANIELASEVLKSNRVAEEKQQQYFNIIHGENQRLKAQVERILELGTIDRNDLRLDLKEVNIHELITKLAASISMRIQDKMGTLNITLNASNPLVVADEFHLTNTVYNVLDNAEKYSPNKPEISISTKSEKEGMIISIKDAGIGIKADLQQYVFDKFFRVPAGNVHNVKGFGLGLSYVKTIIESHRGKITLKSVPDHGSQFDIYLPYSPCR